MNESGVSQFYPSEHYASAGLVAEYMSYGDQNITHLDIPYLFPSQELFRFKAFVEMCHQHHGTDSPGQGYEEVWAGGVLKARGGFCGGRPFGCWRFFHDNGCCAEVICLDGEGNITGEHVLFYSNGNRMFSFCHQGSELTGRLKEWYQNGQIKSEMDLIKGKRDGVFRRWYENGALSEEGECREGVLSGDHRRWNHNGGLVFERTVPQNTRFCEEKYFNDQGKILRTLSYLDHERHGKQIEYFDQARRVFMTEPQVTFWLKNKKVPEAEFIARMGSSL